jgi:hypothetical protein
VTVPVLQALVLADQIYVDKLTGKKVIAGTFNTLWAPEFPAQFPRETWAYICMTEVRGRLSVVLKYVDLLDNSVLMETNAITVDSGGDPLASVELAVVVPGFPMPRAGTYAFELYSGDRLLGALRVRVRGLEDQKT